MLFLRNISYPKLLILLVLLFWAFLLSGQGAQVRASTIAQGGVYYQSSDERDRQETSSFSIGDQLVVRDATPSPALLMPLKAGLHVPAAAFLAPSDDQIPPYAIRAPGKSFLTRIFPTTIQPNAP